MKFSQLLKTWVLLALGVTIAAHTARGIHYDSATALIVAVLLLSVCNMVLKPLLMVFSLPFIILTFGLGIWLINALLFMLVGAIVEGFYVMSFWSALWGALVVSLTSAGASFFFGNSRAKVQINRGQRSGGPAPQVRKPIKDDDVIDI